jgi:hypothetical protein
MANINAARYAGIPAIEASKVRNGTVAGTTATVRGAAIFDEYSWVLPSHAAALDGTAAVGAVAAIPECPSSVQIMASISLAASRFVEIHRREHNAAVAAAQAANNAAPTAVGGADPNDQAAYGTAILGVEENRLKVICLGAARAGTSCTYDITAADLIPAEADQGAYGAAYQIAYTAGAGWTVSAEAAAAGPTEAEARGNALPDLSVVEKELASLCYTIGTLSPPRTGYNLVKQGPAHHYLSGGGQHNREDATEKELLTTCSSELQALWRANAPIFRDMVWHKANHPINVGLLKGFAKSDNVAGILEEMGIGTATVGLPAIESALAKISSYGDVIDKVSPALSQDGDTVQMGYVAMAKLGMELWTDPENGAQQVIPQAPQGYAPDGGVAGTWPAGVVDRKTAIKKFAEPLLAKAEGGVAHMFGYLQAMCEANSVSKNSPEGSILRSYSLKRLKGKQLMMVNKGSAAFLERRRAARARAEDGEIDVYTVVV